MSEQQHTGMARGRALITEAEREHIAGERDDQQRKYEAVSRVRARIEEELTSDVKLLEEHHPELLKELQDVVCDKATATTDSSERLPEPDTDTEESQWRHTGDDA